MAVRPRRDPYAVRHHREPLDPGRDMLCCFLDHQ